jgi:hypothetical protein
LAHLVAVIEQEAGRRRREAPPSRSTPGTTSLNDGPNTLTGTGRTPCGVSAPPSVPWYSASRDDKRKPADSFSIKPGARR